MARKMRDSGVEWIGEVPEGWSISRVKNVVEINHGQDPTTEGAIPVYGSGGGSFKTCGEYKDGPTVLLGRKGTIDAPHYIEGKYWNVDTAFDVKAKTDVSLKWFYYLAICFDYKTYISQTAVPSMTQSDYRNMAIPCPSHGVQRRIADYLDEKCAAIDGAIGELKRGMEDCKAWKKAIIEETVFSGLRHKESVETGDDWLISIPSSWGFEQIRYLFALRDERNDKPLSEVNLISLYTDQGVVQHCDLEKTTGNKASTADGYKIVKENDIVVNIILCWMGAIGRSAYNGVTSPAYDVYRPVDESRVLSRYYHYLFRTSRFNGKCYQEGRGIMMMRWRTYSSEFRAIKVPVPPMKEQQAIADYLDEKCAAIDALVAEKEKLIADLEAYKKSLIFELVTGKREVA